ncbi:hypothetical protein CHAB381_0495 [Campylobacter hominis ATCC BAA-381]|uniref:Uncharacterized protein n=1 Tax=Campylobacter hominis (strain ATCC BAA-381 / DSM 21671 / CCUG 45161 / LMG 19568 / NCTC 13146 / CH001A) TaxID=360107 RepID=A7I0P2_CAMHC|nr:hypothetical protein CHAB381_0495 [Campylobacter hominis ATCC BAA-381]
MSFCIKIFNIYSIFKKVFLIIKNFQYTQVYKFKLIDKFCIYTASFFKLFYF